MSFANTIDDAIALLKGAKEPEPVVDDDIAVDLVKAEDTVTFEAEDATDTVPADDFMIALARNQDINSEKIADGLNSVTKAQVTVLEFIKSFATKIEALDTKLGELASAPQPRKAALTKSEAQNLSKATVPSNKDEQPQISIPQLSNILMKGAQESKCDPGDVLKIETSSNSPVTEVISSLSQGGLQLIREYIGSNN